MTTKLRNRLWALRSVSGLALAWTVLSPHGKYGAALAIPPEKTFSVGSGSWFTPGNWSPSGLPTTAELANINSSVVNVTGGNGTGYSSALYVAFEANTTGTLNITSGGSLYSAKYPSADNSASIGVRLGTNGTVNVGGGIGTSSWTNEGTVAIGVNATGTLNITGGGVVTGTRAVLAYGPNSHGTVNVGGGTGTSTWTLSEALIAGGAANSVGTLKITGGGTVNSVIGAIGFDAAGSSSVTIGGTGGTSTWNNSGEFAIGAYGVGTMTIQTGGVVTSGNGEIGLINGSVGSVLMNGGVGGATWTTPGDLFVGYGGVGALTLTDGSTLSCKNGIIGHEGTSFGSVTVGGGSDISRWTMSEALFVGSQGSGTLTISTRGIVTAASLDGGASFGSSVNFNGGTLRITSTDAAINTINLQANGGTIDVTNAGDTFTILSAMSGAGSLNKAGAGTLALSAANTYGGSTTVAAGTLSMGGPNVLPSGTAVTVLSGATFDLNGYGETIGSLAGAGSVKLGLGYLITGGNNASTTFSGSITGNTSPGGGMYKAGTGTFTLTGTSSYIGDTLVRGGTLTITDGGSVSGNNGYLADNFNVPVTVNVGGGVGNSSWTNTGTLYVGIVGPATLNITSGGTVSAGSLNNNFVGSSVNLNGGTLRITGTDSTTNVINLQSGGGTIDVPNAANTFTIASGLSGAGSLTKTGYGTLLLSSANSYASDTTIIRGTIEMGIVNALPSSTALSVFPEGTFKLAGFDQTIGSLSGSGSVSLGSGVLRVGGNGASTSFFGSFTSSASGGLIKTGAGTLTLYGGGTFGGQVMVTSGTLAINSSVSDATAHLGVATGLTGTVNVNSGGTWTHSGDLNVGSNGSGILNIVGGGTVTNVNGFLANNTGLVGTVNVGGGTGNALWTNTGSLWVGLSGIGTVNITTGGTVSAATLDGGFGSSSVNLNGGTLRITGTDSTSNKINLQSSGGMIDVPAAANTFTITSVIGGAGQLTKAGPGTLALTAANTYSGNTTVSAGKMLASNTTGSATGTGTVTVNSGATLAGGNAAGTQGFIVPSIGHTITINGTVSPGNGTSNIGVLTFGSAANVVNIDISGSYAFQIASTNAGNISSINNGSSSFARSATTGNNLLAVLGTSSSSFDLAGATIQLNANDPTLGGNWSNTRYFSWQFATLPDGVTPTLGIPIFDTTSFAPILNGGTFSLSFVDASNSVYLNFTPSAVPEPSSFLLLGTVGLGLSAWHYRRKVREKKQRFFST